MNSAATEVAGSVERLGRKRKRLTAQEKWQIFLETSAKDASVGEILRRYGAYSSELTKIRRQVEEGALRELGKKRYAKKPESVPYAEHEKVISGIGGKGKGLGSDE